MRDPAGEPASSMNCWFNPGAVFPMIRLYCAVRWLAGSVSPTLHTSPASATLYVLRSMEALGAKNGARHSQPLANGIPQGTSLPAPPGIARRRRPNGLWAWECLPSRVMLFLAQHRDPTPKGVVGSRKGRIWDKGNDKESTD